MTVVEGIAHLQRLDAFDEQIGKLSVHGLLNEDALHGNAGLASVAEASGDAAIGGIGEIGVIVDDHGGVAAEFKNNFLFSGAAFDVPPDGNAAGEADQLNAVIGDEKACVFIRKREDVKATIGPSSLLHALS